MYVYMYVCEFKLQFPIVIVTAFGVGILETILAERIACDSYRCRVNVFEEDDPDRTCNAQKFLSVRTYVYMYVCVFVFVLNFRICAHVLYVCTDGMHICMYVCMYVCVRLSICKYQMPGNHSYLNVN